MIDILVLSLTLSLNDQIVLILLFTLFTLTICIIHLIIVLVRLVTQIVRELESNGSMLEWPHSLRLFGLLNGIRIRALGLHPQLEVWRALAWEDRADFICLLARHSRIIQALLKFLRGDRTLI